MFVEKGLDPGIDRAAMIVEQADLFAETRQQPGSQSDQFVAPGRVRRRQAVDRQLQIDVPQQLGSLALLGLLIVVARKSKGKLHV